MALPPSIGTVLRVSELRNASTTAFRIEPDTPSRKELATRLDIEMLRKLRFEGRLEPKGRQGWTIEGKLGATVVQSCIVTLEPVTTRIDTVVTRRLVPADQIAKFQDGDEIELTDETDADELGDVIDLGQIMEEELALAIPAYPRKDGASLDQSQFSKDGIDPLTDEDVKPFAGLAALKEKMQGGGEES